MILEKKSGLPRSKREYLLYIFEYVNHFTAEDGEEVTQQNEHVPKTKDSIQKIVVDNSDKKTYCFRTLYWFG